MSGSGASNLDYGNIYPNSNVNGEFANKTGSNYAGNFGSNQIPSSAHSMPEPRSNIEAASGIWTGGRRRKNVSRIYKLEDQERCIARAKPRLLEDAENPPNIEEENRALSRVVANTKKQNVITRVIAEIKVE